MKNYRFSSRLTSYGANVALVWASIYLFSHASYYTGFLREDTQALILVLGFGYSIVGFLYYTFAKQDKIGKSKGLLTLQALYRLVGSVVAPKKVGGSFLSVTLPKEEKTALLFLLVKLFFLPLMLNFMLANMGSVQSQWQSFSYYESIFTLAVFNGVIFPFAIALIFLIDTAYFAFGYTFEARALKNQVRSVEPTFFGWFVTLASYPPFNIFVTGIIGWSANDYLQLSSELNTFFLRLTIIMLFLIYLWATIALGAKCSNLTNRGIVARGPYKYVRHPAYIAKNTAWWLTVLPILSIPAFLSMATWTFIYYLRAVTEERHLLTDPEYKEYVKNVRYRFIPRVW